MAEREKLAAIERSTEEIRHDIAQGKENISRTVEQIDERIKEQLDWREYVKDSPYWALGAAAGLGLLASGMFLPRSTPMERIMGSVAEEVHNLLGGQHAGPAGPGVIKVTLLGVATQAAVSWIKKATASSTMASDGAKPRPQTERGATISQRINTEEMKS